MNVFNLNPDQWPNKFNSIQLSLYNKNGDIVGFFICFSFWDMVSLCSPGYLRTPYVNQAGLKLREILLPLLVKCWELKEDMCHHAQSSLELLKMI